MELTTEVVKSKLQRPRKNMGLMMPLESFPGWSSLRRLEQQTKCCLRVDMVQKQLHWKQNYSQCQSHLRKRRKQRMIQKSEKPLRAKMQRQKKWQSLDTQSRYQLI